MAVPAHRVCAARAGWLADQPGAFQPPPKVRNISACACTSARCASAVGARAVSARRSALMTSSRLDSPPS
jgi:hypothetical protein